MNMTHLNGHWVCQFIKEAIRNVLFEKNLEEKTILGGLFEHTHIDS